MSLGDKKGGKKRKDFFLSVFFSPSLLFILGLSVITPGSFLLENRKGQSQGRKEAKVSFSAFLSLLFLVFLLLRPWAGLSGLRVKTFLLAAKEQRRR